MAEWTEDQKKSAIAQYLAAEPTPETSMEIVKEIAEKLEQSPNGVRMILTTAKVYIKKDAATAAPPKAGTKAGTATAGKKPTKESQLTELKTIIEANGGTVDLEIIDKLTGKAAQYFTDQFKAVLAASDEAEED